MGTRLAGCCLVPGAFGASDIAIAAMVDGDSWFHTVTTKVDG